MTELESYIVNQLTQFTPKAEKLEVRMNVGDEYVSLEFFATTDGVRRQCYDMIDKGEIEEKSFYAVARQIASQIRASADYRPGEVNKVAFTAEIK